MLVESKKFQYPEHPPLVRTIRTSSRTHEYMYTFTGRHGQCLQEKTYDAHKTWTEVAYMKVKRLPFDDGSTNTVAAGNFARGL